ncbi:MAG: polyhydroxyalkanoic acid system family protein [Planctomycetaceae bacterium]|nr:polyhydroxyalkanoic acid system family protein [Planctomycetaceae bacterium]
MPKISISKEHALNQATVTAVIKSKIAKALSENAGAVSQFKETWPDENTMQFAFKVMGMSVDGVLKSLPNQVSVEATLPLAAMMVKGLIESRLKEEIGKILAEAG